MEKLHPINNKLYFKKSFQHSVFIKPKQDIIPIGINTKLFTKIVEKITNILKHAHGQILNCI